MAWLSYFGATPSEYNGTRKRQFKLSESFPRAISHRFGVHIFPLRSFNHTHKYRENYDHKDAQQPRDGVDDGASGAERTVDEDGLSAEVASDA